MSDWRYVAVRLPGDGTVEVIDPDLPLSGASLTTAVSGPATISGKISPAFTRLLADDGEPLIQRWTTAILAVRPGGQIHCGGIVTQMTREGPDLSLSCMGLSGYPKGLPYQGDIFYVQKDPLDIARAIWAYVQGRARGNLGLVVDQKTKVGVLIGTELRQVQFDTQNGPVSFEAGPYKLNWYETDDLGKNLDDLAGYGFDYEERWGWSAAGLPVPYLDFGVPRIGTRRLDIGFMDGDNVITPPGEEFAADGYASEVIVRGAGEGRTMVRGYAARPGETRLARPITYEDKNIKSVKEANAKAAAILAQMTGRPVVSGVTVLDSTQAPLGSWRDGDEVELTVHGEWGSSSDFYRVLSTTIAPDDLSAAQVSLVRADMLNP